MKVLVTGASGFLGGHLVERLVERGDEVRCLVRPRSDRTELGRLGVRLVEGDLEDERALRDGLHGADVVIHAGALTRKVRQRREDLFRVNEGGTERLLDACEKNGKLARLVLVSTLAAVGPGDGRRPVAEDAPCVPLTDYGASKLAGERAVLARKERIPVSVVRLPGLYGPRDVNLAALYRLARRRMRPVSARRVAFLHVRDAADALITVAEHPRAAGELFHASGEELTVTALGRAIAASLGVWAAPLWLPRALLIAAATLGEAAGLVTGRAPSLDLQKARDLGASWRVDTGKIQDRLGWRPRFTFAQSAGALADWYRERGWLSPIDRRVGAPQRPLGFGG